MPAFSFVCCCHSEPLFLRLGIPTIARAGASSIQTAGNQHLFVAAQVSWIYRDSFLRECPRRRTLRSVRNGKEG